MQQVFKGKKFATLFFNLLRCVNKNLYVKQTKYWLRKKIRFGNNRRIKKLTLIEKERETERERERERNRDNEMVFIKSATKTN